MKNENKITKEWPISLKSIYPVCNELMICIVQEMESSRLQKFICVSLGGIWREKM